MKKRDAKEMQRAKKKMKSCAIDMGYRGGRTPQRNSASRILVVSTVTILTLRRTVEKSAKKSLSIQPPSFCVAS